MKKTLALLLAVVMCLGMLAACAEKGGNTNTNTNTNTNGNQSGDNSGNNTGDTTTPGGEDTGSDETEEPATYTYKDSVSTMATNWNPHTYQTSDDSYPASFIRSGLYTFVFNDELNPVEGKDPYAGYKIIPEMAAEMPIDVTTKIAAEHPEFNIPADATAGFAYEIKLNPDCTWEDGTPINADTYVYSLKRLLDPDLMNYRAADYYADNFAIAGAENYYNQGTTAWAGKLGMSVEDYLAKGGKVEDLYVDISGFWGVTTDDGKSFASVLDDTMYRDPAIEEGQPEDYVSGKYLYDNYLAPGAVYAAYQSEYLGTVKAFEDNYDFANVGIIKNDEYSITIVLGKSLAGFNLLYNLTGNWIVKEDLYEANLTEDNGVWTSTYNTNVETTSSYGPYKLVSYQADKAMRYEINENWWGWTDGKHEYVDPVDGETYQMYMTTAIDTQVVAEAETRKLMFLKGELMGYGLQAADFATYRNSDYVYFTPSETIYFLILNGHVDAIKNREAAEDFDTAQFDLETITNLSFRKAVGVTYDKELFASTVSPARSGGYGLIGNSYIYDPDTGARYRDTDQAKKALCEFYSVDVSKYADLDAAVASITGYDPVVAKELYNQAFDECLAAGYITDTNGDGICDQTIQIEYALSSDSDFMTTTIDYLNEKMTEVTNGTAFEGKVKFVKSAPYGNEWSNKIKAGLSDTVLGGWSGSALNPFGLTDLYVNPNRAYDGKWFDGTKVELTINVGGEDITLTLKQWSDALNGTPIAVGDKTYNWGDGIADVATRLDILAAIETRVLQTYNYLPTLQDASAALLSQQVFYVIEEYNPIMGRGGIQYMKYNYSDAEWAEYVASEGG